MKRIFFVIALMFSVCSLSAQFSSAIEFKKRLSEPDSLHNSRVVVVEDRQIITQLNRGIYNSDNKIKGYRVRIFFDNSQRARSSANNVKTQFKSIFSDIPVYMIYENPYFKITVGDCLSFEEAIVVWGRVKESFPKAFIVREDIPLINLIKTTEQAVVEPTTDSETTPAPVENI